MITDESMVENTKSQSLRQYVHPLDLHINSLLCKQEKLTKKIIRKYFLSIKFVLMKYYSLIHFMCMCLCTWNVFNFFRFYNLK